MASLKLTRTLSSPTERVWDALTDPEALAAWFWPQLDNTVESLISGPGGDTGSPARRSTLPFPVSTSRSSPRPGWCSTWQWDGEEEISLVTVELTPAGSGTELVLTHDRLTEEVVGGHTEGWEGCLDRLPAYLAG